MNGWTKETKNMGQGKMAVDWNEPRRGKFQSLRTKLIVYFCLVFAVVLLAAQALAVMGVPFTSYGGRLGQQKTEAFRSLNLIADLKKDRLLRWLERRRHSADAIFDNSIVRADVALLCAKIGQWAAAGRRDAGLWAEAGKEKSYGYLVNYLNNFRTTYGRDMYERIFIAEANTGKVFISTDVADLGADISRQSYFTGALDSPKNYVDKVQLAQGSQSPFFYLSKVLHDTGGKTVAVAVIEINLEDITVPMLHTGDGLGKGGEALLVNQNMMAITRLKHNLADGTRTKPLEYQIRARPAMLAARGEDGIIESEDYRGEPVLAAYRFIPVTSEWGWGMVVKRDKAELYAPLRLETTYSIFISLAGVLAVVGLTVVMARNLTQPILSLSQVAHKVSEGDFAVRASVTTSDEVGKLAWTFNSMLQRVGSWHQQLEAEVKTRTAELNKANEELTREINERQEAEEEIRRLNAELEQRITERTAELVAANKELEAFSYSVSHDLRAPLRSIDGFSQALLEDYTDKLDAQGKDYLQRVRVASQRMAALIDDLLNLARVTRHEMRRETVDMSALAWMIAQDLKRRDPGRKVEFVIAEGVRAHGDAHLLRVVLENLIGNAWKFSRKHSTARIELGVKEQESKSAYFVRDDGAGFDMAYADKLFGPFQRLHGMTEFEGTGIGLATVQRTIHRHGGRVWAESAVEQGATFYFTL
jgi:signal transduction histidine kinase